MAEAKKTLSQMLARCKSLIGSSRLSVWESGFLEHIKNVVEVRGIDALTENQRECLTRIHREQFAKEPA